MKTLKYFIFIILAILMVFCFSMCRTLKDTKYDKQNVFVIDTTYESIVPWNDVINCLGNRLPRYKFKDHDSCPICGLKSEKLIWIKFETPPITWRMLCGSKGPLSICPKCNIQVEFILEMMN